MNGVPPVPNYHSKTPAVNMSPKGNISKVCVYSFMGRRLGVCTEVYHSLGLSPAPWLLLLASRCGGGLGTRLGISIDTCTRIASMVYIKINAAKIYSFFPKPHQDFISQLWKKNWEWPGNKAR